MKEKRTIGRKDKLDLPDFGLVMIPVKIDSGAYSCSIDCHRIKEIEREGEKVLEVVFLQDRHPAHTGKPFYFSQFRNKSVKSSNGEVQNRYLISARVTLFGEDILTDFSLTCRHEMKNPVLIGRKLLNHRFLIDSSKVNLSYKERRMFGLHHE